MNTIIDYILYILLSFLAFILLSVMLGFYLFIESHQSEKIAELKMFNISLGLYIILITTIFYNAYANYYLKDNPIFIKKMADLLNKSYLHYIRKICKNVLIDLCIYNCILQELLLYIGENNVKEIIGLTFILSKLYFCKYASKKYKIVYFVYLSILSLFIFKNNLAASALYYIFANIITYISKKYVTLDIFIKNNYKKNDFEIF